MSDAAEHRKLAAIMFTDMVGYSALSQRDDKLALELLEEHRRLLREIFPRFHGTEIKTIGDAFLVEFNSALEAAQCAIEIQRTLAKRNHDVTADRHIELKIGIHIGDVVHRGGDVYGDGVNIASRIEPLAGAGGICVSMDVERQIRNAVETRFEKLAATELKNISVPMELFRIVLPWERKAEVRGQKSEVRRDRVSSPRAKWAWAAVAVLLVIIGVGWWWTAQPRRGSSASASDNGSAPRQNASPARTGAATIPEKSIAVLPFENLSDDKSNAYFAEGIQDEILTRLSKIAALKVISRTSTQKYKTAPDNLREVGQQLGVANLLEGSVQKARDAVHVNVQLIRAVTDEHLWAESYDRKLDDIFGVEKEVAQNIASALNAKLSGAEERVLAQKPTDNPAAYDAYLRGIAQYWQVSDESQKAALHSFEEAVRLDPQFALAWAALSQAHSRDFFHDDMTPTRRAAAEKALAEATRLQPNLPETRKARAYFQYWVVRDYKGALEMMQELRASWPNNAELLQAMGFISARLGQWKEALDDLKQSVALNPHEIYPRTMAISIAMAMRDFAKVTEMADNALQIWPDNSALLGYKAFAFQARGELDEAQSVLNRLPSQPSGLDTGGVALFYQSWLRRDPSIARKLFDALAAAPESNDPSFLLYWATWLDLAGRKSEANATFVRARDRFLTIVKEQPENASAMGPLVVALAATGQRDDALKMLNRFDAACGDDARARGTAAELDARIFARLGDKDRSIASLERLLSAPSDPIYGPPVTPALLRLDPDFDPLRGDPRFEKLCQEK